MTNGAAPVIAMVWEGKDVVKQGRAIIGATNPLESAPGTVRGQFCISVGRNIIHGRYLTTYMNHNVYRNDLV
jgi:nucleoside-diphosphate kinase